MILVGVIIGYGTATLVDSGFLSSEDTIAEAQPQPSVPQAPAEPVAKDVVPVDPAEDNIMGDKGALISVIEYSDFECPFCVRHHGTMKQLVAEMDDVNWVYRHYPLPFHSNSQKAAEASECAAEQGKFWEFADKVFESGPAVSSLTGYAGELGLDTGDFDDCLNSGKYEQKVNDQMDAGSNSGISGTPGNIVINNKTKETKFVSGAQPIAAFKNAIEVLK